MTSDLVSIAMCTYNGATYLREQLDSLINQTYKNLEIIIVDDCSHDTTLAILAQYKKDYPQIKLFINDENIGYTKNFEKAIRLCKGEYIALCDQDDIWACNKIEILVKLIGNNILAYHDSEFIDEQGNSLNKKVSDIRNCYSGNDSRVFLFDNCVLGHAIFFKRGLLKFTCSFNNLIIHDRWLAYVATNVGSIIFINQPLVKYRRHSNASTNILQQWRANITKNNSIEKMKFQLEVTNVFVDYPFNSDLTFKKKLLDLLRHRMGSYISFSLSFFIFKNRDTLFYIQKKQAISKMNIMKFFFGGKIKRLPIFNVYR